MQIVGVELTAVAVPYKPELGTVVTAGLQLSEARHILVEIHTDVGLIGLGEAVPRPSVYGETLDGQRAVIEGLLAPPILGLDPLRVERAWAAWERVVGNQAAKAALDMGLHDLIGKQVGLPIHRLLGGWTEGTLPLTMSLGIGPPERMADGARQAVADGHGAVKLKVGKDVDADVRAVAAVREAVGPDVVLYVDANGGYGRNDALRAIRAFERYELALIEEPVAPGDADGRMRLARATDVPLLADESTNDMSGLVRELAAGSAGGISIRAARSGFTLTRHLVNVATASHVPFLIGSHRELGVGTAANAHLAGFRGMAWPAELGSHVHLEDGLLETPLRIEGGVLHLPDGPGLGVSLDRDKVERYRVWSSLVGERPA